MGRFGLRNEWRARMRRMKNCVCALLCDAAAAAAAAVCACSTCGTISLPAHLRLFVCSAHSHFGRAGKQRSPAEAFGFEARLFYGRTNCRVRWAGWLLPLFAADQHARPAPDRQKRSVERWVFGYDIMGPKSVHVCVRAVGRCSLCVFNLHSRH